MFEMSRRISKKRCKFKERTTEMGNESNILMYSTEDGITRIEVTYENETVWLSIDQMAELFQRDRSVIGKHIRNIFKEGELVKESVWAKFAYTAADGKQYDVDYYNLDVIFQMRYNITTCSERRRYYVYESFGDLGCNE